MASKANTQWLDAVEEMFNKMQGRTETVEEMMSGLHRKLDRLLQLQEETTLNATSSSIGKENEAAIFTRARNSRIKDLTGTDNPYGSHLDLKLRKLEMPTFHRTNSVGWILKAEGYFNLNHFSNEGKLEAVIISFQGDALMW